MRKNSIKERSSRIPADIKLMVSKSIATARQINRILKNQRKSQRDLAVMLGKKESEISRWLQGTHNFTYRTICKIEVALGEQIILTADQAIQNVSFYYSFVSNRTAQELWFEEKSKASNLSTLSTKKLTAIQNFEKNGLNKISLSQLEESFN